MVIEKQNNSTGNGERIRILHAFSTGVLGGTNLAIFELVRRLNPERFACETSFLDGLGPICEHWAQAGFPVHDLRGRFGLLSAGSFFWRLLSSRRYHIIHLYGFRMSLLGRIAAHCCSPRPGIIHGIRGLHVTQGEEVGKLKTRLAIILERWASPLIDHYIANSRGAADFLQSRGLSSKKFTVIPSGVDVDPLSNSNQKTDDIPKIICVSNFHPVKRHVDLIMAVSLLRDAGFQVRCLLVGDGTYKSNIKKMVQDRGLTDMVEFRGSLQPFQVQEALGRADIFVLPSLWEGLPRSIMEAMAAGLPVVATDVSGSNELVVDGETGFLVPVKDFRQLALHLEQLIKNPALRVQMGQTGRLRIHEQFSWQSCVAGHEKVYSDIYRSEFDIQATA